MKKNLITLCLAIAVAMTAASAARAADDGS